jgi:hypothetical protein
MPFDPFVTSDLTPNPVAGLFAEGALVFLKQESVHEKSPEKTQRQSSRLSVVLAQRRLA